MSKLTITIDLEDHSASLFGKFESENFSGIGKGWFYLIDLKQFCNSFEKLIETNSGTANIVGSLRQSDGTGYLETLGLRSYVVSKTGILGVHVTLADYPYTDCRAEEISKVFGEVKVETQSAINFLNQLRKLIVGEITEAILYGKG